MLICAEKERLTVRSILVQHERCTRLDLSLENRIPELLGLDRLPTTALLLVALIELLELLTPDFSETRCLIGTEQRPLAVSLDALHATIH